MSFAVAPFLAPNATPDVIAVLRRVRTRLTPPAAWMQHDFSLTVEGAPCHVSAPTAACWCLEGAISAEIAYYPGPAATYLGSPDLLDIHRGVFVAILETVGLRGSGLTLAGWNDAPGRQHDEVLGVLDLTIARLCGPETGAAA